MKIDDTQFKGFQEYLEKLQNKTKNINDSIPIIKDEVESRNVNTKIELNSGSVEVVSRKNKQIKKFIEATSVIPVSTPKPPSQPKQVKEASFSKLIKENKKVAKKQDIRILRKNIVNAFMKWYLQK